MAPSPPNQPLSVVSTIIGAAGNCFCEVANLRDRHDSGVFLFLELRGVECIALGSIDSELTAAQRVQDTIAQLSEQMNRMIGVGYFMEAKITKTIPLEIWEREYPQDLKLITKEIRQTIHQIKEKKFKSALKTLFEVYEHQKKYPNVGRNKFISGITCHNIAVLYVLSEQLEEKALPFFRQALELKRGAFGVDHPQVMKTLNEIGIQLFAQRNFAEALEVFHGAKIISTSRFGLTHPSLSMLLNNIGCCRFSQGNFNKAFNIFLEAIEIEKGTARDDLDVLHVGMTMSNLGYILIQMKQYEKAQEMFEEALLLQQSVLEDGHRAIQGTMRNLQFSNAFHC